MNRNLILIALSLFIWGVGESMFYDFRPLYLQALGADPIAIGSILGIVGAAMALSHIPAGYLSDRIGPLPLIRASWILGLVSGLMMAVATEIHFFSLGAVIYGITFFVSSPLNSYITAVRGKLSVGRTFTLISAFFSLGGILGPWLGGMVAEHWGLRSVLFFACGLFVLSTLVIFFIQPQQVNHTARTETLRGSMREVFSPQFTLYLVIVFIVFFIMFLPQPLSPNFLQNQRGMKLSEIGQFLSFAGMGVVFFNLVLGHLPLRWGYLAAQVVMLVFSLCLWQGEGYLWLGLGYFCMGSFRTARSLAASQAKEFLPDHRLGIGYGAVESLDGLAMMLAPLLAGWLYSIHPEWIYQWSLAGGSAVLVLTLFTLTLLERKQDAARAVLSSK